MSLPGIEQAFAPVKLITGISSRAYFTNRGHRGVDDRTAPCVLSWRVASDFVNEFLQDDDCLNPRFPVDITHDGDHYVIKATCLLPFESVMSTTAQNVYPCVKEYADFLLPYAIIRSMRSVKAVVEWFDSLDVVTCVPHIDWCLSDYGGLVDKQLAFIDQRCTEPNWRWRKYKTCRELLFSDRELDGRYMMKIVEYNLEELESFRDKAYPLKASYHDSWWEFCSDEPWWDLSLESVTLSWALCYGDPRKFKDCRDMWNSGFTRAQIVGSAVVQEILHNQFG